MTQTFDPRTVGQILDRAGRRDFDRWAQQVQHSGYCSRPVRLTGTIARHDSTGGRTITYMTAAEPDGVLLVRCGNRRASACPSCSHEYAGDMWQLLYAGAAGGRKGVPDTIRSHPLVFATLTAPSFGPVHTTRTGTGRPGRCHPGPRPQQACEHGHALSCTAVHDHGDPALGQPLCPDCYSYAEHAAFNWHAPELWRRFTIALRRTLARRSGLTIAAFHRRARINFVKVAEFQRRAVVHFHALIRLDGPDPYTPADLALGVDDLADAIRTAAASVRLTVDLPGHGDGSTVLRFGTQTDVQPVNGGQAGELTPNRVAAYIAKYATKSAEDFGLGDRRIHPEALPMLGVTEHVARLVQTCWDLGDHAPYAGLRTWLHMLGFRGHFASKSRRYSTTLGAIRAERHRYRLTESGPEPPTDDTTLVVANWTFTGLGHLTDGDQILALSAAARAREHRETARENRHTSSSQEGTVCPV